MFIRRYWNLIRKYMEVQNGNINPHKHTSEASICKMFFPKKRPPNFFHEATSSCLVMRSERSHFFVKSWYWEDPYAQLFCLVALALDLTGDRLFQKELVEKGQQLGHFFEKCPKISNLGSKFNHILIWLANSGSDGLHKHFSKGPGG